jgi:parallel beta-helix repeat protein
MTVNRKKLKRGIYLHFLKNLIICPGSVVAYHPSLSSLGLGFKFRPGRYINFKKNINCFFCFFKILERMKKTIPACLTLILFLTIFTVFYPIENVKGETLHVGDGQTYSTIQSAINAANESGGDIIYVHEGTYPSPIVIDRPLTLAGEGSATVTISASNAHTIKVTADNVIISGFKIQNNGGSYYCLFLDSVSSCEITNNNVRNGGHGIYLDESDSNTINDNTIEYNNIGLYLFNSDSNIIKSNNIQNNNANGIWITSTCNANTIYLNDFFNNLDGNARDFGSNNWNYNFQGNYWDDYNDYDSNGDGVGDNPYVIEGGNGNKDNYPLGDFLNPNQQLVAYIDSINPNPATYGQTIYFSGHGSPSGSIVEWEWLSDGVVIGPSASSFSTSVLSLGSHSISFRVKGDNEEWSDYDTATLVINLPSNKPTAYILEPTTSIIKNYGESIEFLGDWSDDGEIVEYSWRSSIDGVLSDAIQFTKNNFTVGQHLIYFKVRDDDGEWSSEVSIGVLILSNSSNNAPVAIPICPSTGYINQNISFDGSSSYDPDTGDTITSYKWDFGDGATGEGVSTMHIYTSEGNFTVELTVIDSNGEKSSNTTFVKIVAQDDDQNGGNGKDGRIPGFETVFVIVAIAFILFYKRKIVK